MLQRRHQHDIPFRAARRKSPGQSVEQGGAATAGENSAVALGIGAQEAQDLAMRPMVGVAGDTGGKMRLAVSIGVMSQQGVGYLPGRLQRQGRSRRVEVMAARFPTIGERVVGGQRGEIALIDSEWRYSIQKTIP